MVVRIADGDSARSKNSLDLMLKKDGAVMGIYPREISTNISACRSGESLFDIDRK